MKRWLDVRGGYGHGWLLDARLDLSRVSQKG